MTAEKTTETREDRIKRLIYRSIYTGTRETDLLIGNFAKRNLDSLNDELLDEYEALIDNSDPDLYMWISRRKPVPDAWNGEIIKRLQNFRIEE
ncbi:MAG: succinate dehydrogenase assembly factor 2 [Alphaproteobacteria bacterium]